ncbi:MAG: EF-P lysine aminoacylase EpmA [Alphaproteobacteria bacterium]
MSGNSPWWSRARHADRRPLLIARARALKAIRNYFDSEGFTEVECGALQVSPGNEAHLHAFATEWIAPGEMPRRLYLHTSPEFACKKLLAAGETRIFAVARVYRNRERGALHAPEFTMLEWYRAEEPYDAIIADTVQVMCLAAQAARCKEIGFRDLRCDPFAGPERISVADAFRKFANVDLLSALSPDGKPDRAKLANAAIATGVKVSTDDTWSDIYSKILVERVEPHLGAGRPTILDRYPRAKAALARACADDPRVAERFELYVCGVELANGFGELTDPAEQRRRFEAEMAEKERVYGERYPLDEEFLAALAAMPEASGVALGFDRLVMLVTGARRIDDVTWTPPAGA